MLALQSKTCWGSVFNLEGKTVCQTGLGAFVGHRNKLSSREDVSKRNCPRLRAKTLHSSGGWVTQQWRLGDSRSECQQPSVGTECGELGRFVGWTQMEHQHHIPAEIATAGEKIWWRSVKAIS